MRLLPGVDTLLKHECLAKAGREFGHELVKDAIQRAIDNARTEILERDVTPDPQSIIRDVEKRCREVSIPSLRAVVNATGILIHTNLGRAPLGRKILADIQDVVMGYSNLEFDLATGARGNRKVHLSSLLRHATGAQDTLVVNNNAAALVLALNTLARNKEVIVSRGELIEIGGSFRIPEILEASGARMVEVGTTNRTRIGDYEKAMTEDTAILLKAHKSNFAISGFTEEAGLSELVGLGAAKKIPVLFDIGSGLLRKPDRLPLSGEPDVKSAIGLGVDLVAFSGDKLLGGPQSGIIAGRQDLISRLERAPLMRALRVGKLTIAALSSAVRSYLDDSRLVESLPLFAMMNSTPETLKRKAEALRESLQRFGVHSEIAPSSGRCGGGTLPELQIESYAVVLKSAGKSRQKRSDLASRLFHHLLEIERPILGVLRQGELLFDVLTLDESDFEHIGSAVSEALLAQKSR